MSAPAAPIVNFCPCCGPCAVDTHGFCVTCDTLAALDPSVARKWKIVPIDAPLARDAKPVRWDGIEIVGIDGDRVRLARIGGEVMLSVEEPDVNEDASAAALTVENARALRDALDAFVREAAEA